jgi:hypothetical protein
VASDEERLEVTAAGVAEVEEWLSFAASLFARWPPDVPGVDGATG